MSANEGVVRAAALRIVPTFLLVDGRETSLDALKYFYEIIFVVHSLIDYEANVSPGKAKFRLEVSIVPALYLVATKCRSSSLHRQPIDLLLSSHRREGMWDSFLASKVGS